MPLALHPRRQLRVGGVAQVKLCLAVDYGTTNPLHALLIGLGVNDTLYVVAEWRYDSRAEGRQLTDVEYSRRLRDWLYTVKLQASELRGPKPRFAVIDPSAASFKVQMYQDDWSVTDGVNAVVDGIRLVSALLAVDRLKIHRSCKGLIDEIPGYSWSEAHAERGEDVPVKADDHVSTRSGTGVRPQGRCGSSGFPLRSRPERTSCRKVTTAYP